REYGWRIYEDMAQDAMIAGALNDIVSGVVTQRPEVRPRIDDDPYAERAARFVAHQLDALAMRGQVALLELFRSLLRTCLVYGHAVSEMVYRIEEADLYAPLALPFQADDAFTLHKLVPALPSRYSFAVTAEGDILGITPSQVSTASPIAIFASGARVRDPMVVPSVKLLHLVFRRIGLDPTGESLLTPAFKPWAMKKEIEEQMMRLAKRWRKSWLGKLPPDAQNVCVANPETGEQEYIRPREDLLQVLQALANGDGGVVPATTEVQSFDIEVNASANYFIELHKLLNREILRAIYSRMLANNNDAAASTTGEFDREMVSKTVRAIRAWYEDSLTQLGYKLLLVNCGETFAELYAPRIVVGRGDGLSPTLLEVAQLHQAGWFTRAQKQAMDERFGFPEDDQGAILGADDSPQA
ncbi:MAG: hypothetical protein ACK4JD_12570, partial [Thermoflexales bacterium]